jgi:cardiolipin synthase
MKATTGGTPSASSSVLTVPNLISAVRILAIPPVVWLIVRPQTTSVGIFILAVVLATDWVDGLVARRTGQVSELGRILDPLADRLVLAAGLIALMVRGALPVWAGSLVLARDAVVVAVGAVVLVRRRLRIDVRFLGKLATASLMAGVVGISWGNLAMPLGDVALAVGWVAFTVGLVEAYAAAGFYLRDVRRAG